ncbi:MAG: ABC transporter ATP-binding protein [Proteobacteria bacterium]|nr:MAG: ABC transporter ATP-binding protein [Pseudomonadota bacterium]
MTLRLEDLSKQFSQSGFHLGPLNLDLKAGARIALFGKNGAGKTTLFQLVTGHMAADSGVIELFGQRMNVSSFELKKRIGYLPQHLELPRWVSAYDLITYAVKLYEFTDLERRRSEILERWDASYYANKPLGACSYGMQKRVGLALATLHNPELLILDEPFSGLDLFHIRTLEELLAERTKDQITIVSTHVASHVARLCDRAIVVRDGKLEEIDAWAGAAFMERLDLMEDQFFPRSKGHHS